VVHLGCGGAETVDTDALRKAAAAFVRAAGRAGAAAFVLPAPLLGTLSSAPESGSPLPPAARRAAQAVTEGAILAGYRFTAHRSSDDDGRISTLVVMGVDLEAEVLAEGVRRGTVVADAVAFARDLVNEPPSSLTPSALAAAVARYFEGAGGVTLEVWDEERISAERLGGLLGVARGSAEPPRLLKARFEPADPIEVGGRVPHVVLVGKGITFDSGGLSLKTADGMTTMKTDMSGAAAVMAAIGACGELGVRVRVTAIAPVTENMPGGRAQKPGDVLTIRNGRTIEVLNTDAEGRLVLADGLSLAVELEPDVIVDLATLTGAQMVALGRSIGGLFASDETLSARLQEAGQRASERLWPLPLADEYRSDIDSEVADMKNIGKPGQAGAIVAALLLQQFVEGIPWAHLDIAGPARSDESSGVLTKGGTGFGVRTLLEFLDRLGAEPLPSLASRQA
jgi:leucyl aminopeptidase